MEPGDNKITELCNTQHQKKQQQIVLQYTVQIVKGSYLVRVVATFTTWLQLRMALPIYLNGDQLKDVEIAQYIVSGRVDGDKTISCFEW